MFTESLEKGEISLSITPLKKSICVHSVGKKQITYESIQR